MTRSMMRGVSALAACAAMAAGLLLSGCGAGQETQTEGQNPPISGVNVDSADGTIQLRNVAIQYSDPEGYENGGSAPLLVRVMNQNLEKVSLVGVTTDAGTVVLAGPGAVPSSAPATTPPPAPPSGSASGSASGSPSGSLPPSGSGSASGPASEPPSVPPSSAPAGNPTINVEIASRGLAVLDKAVGQYLLITGLREEIKPGDTVRITFRFSNGVMITTPVPIAVPLTPPARSPMHFDEEGH